MKLTFKTEFALHFIGWDHFDVSHGLDGKLVTAALTAPLPGEDRFKR